jgi:hypothetical protein
MTTHEFDAYLDMQPDEHFEPDYHEQLIVMQEMEEAHNATLKQQGAKEALDELKLFLLISGNDERCKEEFWGLKWSIDAINRRLSKLEITEGGVA